MLSTAQSTRSIKRSHIKILNNKGSKLDRCGTPNKIVSKKNIAFIYFCHSYLAVDKPRCRYTETISMQFSNTGHVGDSKALHKSVNNAPKDFPISVADFHFSINDNHMEELVPY